MQLSYVLTQYLGHKSRLTDFVALVGMVMRGDERTADELIRPTVQELVRQGRQLGFGKQSILDAVSNAWKVWPGA